MKFTSPIPLSLYIHMPWCIQKCPYCDFNSHQATGMFPEKSYIETLILDLEKDLEKIWGRRIVSVFIGGGTPSLFSAESLDKLLTTLRSYLPLTPGTEITMEANPGSFEQERFKDYCDIGINRLSIGIQSFNGHYLKKLGRVHDDLEAHRAIDIARHAGFKNINLDLMHSLPHQTLSDAMEDLHTAIQKQPEHLSWYQLTIEPNTVFYKHPPVLPEDDLTFDIENTGKQQLAEAGFNQYEVSAYAQYNKQCLHNRNYWEFGDYLGIGAGAHSKITDVNTGQITRFYKKKLPKAYMESSGDFIAEKNIISSEDAVFEFMLNALRLNEKISLSLFTERTGLPVNILEKPLTEAASASFIELKNNNVNITEKGRHFLNDLVGLFLNL